MKQKIRGWITSKRQESENTVIQTLEHEAVIVATKSSFLKAFDSDTICHKSSQKRWRTVTRRQKINSNKWRLEIVWHQLWCALSFYFFPKGYNANHRDLLGETFHRNSWVSAHLPKRVTTCFQRLGRFEKTPKALLKEQPRSLGNDLRNVSCMMGMLMLIVNQKGSTDYSHHQPTIHSKVLSPSSHLKLKFI